MIILEDGERAEQFWGMYTEIITDEMIEALEQGKRLYLSVNDEYAVVIKKNGKRKTDKPEQTDSDTISRQTGIICCKNCKHWHKQNNLTYCDRIDYGYGYKPDDFCSYAERK